jgi:Dyp-type peroxidase family
MPPLPQWNDMQGLVLSAYPHLECAAYVPLIVKDPMLARAWILRMATHVTTAFARVNAVNLAASMRFVEGVPLNINIAVSYAGLRELVPISDAAKLTFPAAFVEGIAGSAHRSRILGDVGDNDPTEWDWGGEKAVHVLLMVFAENKANLTSALGVALTGCGMEVVGEVLTALPLAEAKGTEHFGFVDGRSQPILEGTADADRFPESMHLTALGEFVYGYPDGEQIVAKGPSVDRWTHPSTAFGMNGTFVVFRQLEQDVAGFWNAARDAVGPAADADAAEQLASKIIGRRPDATPLVPYGSRDDNEFTFADDRHGYGCPVGAHIRRAHPRGSLPGTSPADRSNRHRLLRRARSYGSKLADRNTPDGQKRGLLFLALNGDFERQFEFINQNWVNSPAFCGLVGERDPLVNGEPRRFTVPGMPARTVVPNLPRFVTVRGGEYFFLPGIRALYFLGGGSPDADNGAPATAGDAETAKVIAVLEDQVRHDYAPPRVKRDAHPKAHGLVQAVLEVDRQIPADLKHGVFAREGTRYRTWIRFSNAVGIEHDLEAETRGMGIKLLDVPGDKLAPDEETTQDFLLATSDAFFLPNGKDYDVFAKAVGDGGAQVLKFFWKRRLCRGFRQLFRSMFALTANPLAVPYFSQTPYKLGGHDVKLQARPRLTPELRATLPAAWLFACKVALATVGLKMVEGDKKRKREEWFDVAVAPFNLLRLAMMAFLAEHEATFDLLVQKRVLGSRRTPVDDPTVSWPERLSPFERVATLTIPRQAFWPDTAYPPELKAATIRMMELGENMSFNPWHALRAHEPLGAINQMRRRIYPAIADLRRTLNQVETSEPTVQEYDDLKNIVQL